MSVILCSRDEESRALSHGIIMCTEEEADFLMHYRIPGSKNGVRRWQYEDGSLTPEGYIHYGIGKGNKHQNKADKLEKKVEKAQSKLDKHLARSNSLVGRVFGNKAKQNTRETLLKRKLEVAQAKQRIEARKAKEQEERGLAKFEKDKQTDETELKPKESDGLDKPLQEETAKKEHDRFELMDMARSEFTGDKEHDEDLRNVPNDVVKERIELIRDWYNDEVYMDKEQREKSLKDNSEKYLSGELSDEDRKEFGNDLLSYVDEKRDEIKAIISPNGKYDPKAARKLDDTHEYDTYDKLQAWLTDQVYEKSGSWNSGYFKDGTNGKNEYPKLEKAYEDEWHRWGEVEKEIGYKPNGTSRETERLERAIKNDKVSQALGEISSKAEKDLCGAILKDLGFSDTPANRAMIIRFAFLD